MSLFLLLQQCPAYIVHLIWMVLEMGGKWPYSYCFVGCCFLDLFSIAHSILVQFLFTFFSIQLVSVHVAHPYSRIDNNNNNNDDDESSLMPNPLYTYILNIYDLVGLGFMAYQPL